MQTILIVLVILVALAIIVQVVSIVRTRSRGQNKEEGAGEGMKLIMQQVNELSRVLDRKVGDLTRTVDSKLEENSRSMRDSMKSQLGESSRLIKEVTQGLVKLDETNRQVVSFADQLKNLQDILKNPKHRGILGEYYLETLLKNVLAPSQYQMQYAFKNGEVVDAVVFVKDKIIPIDSKFSLENYNKISEESNPVELERLKKTFVGDLKTRIQETSKYIRPDENTMEFAFMFIPHEAIYYDLLVNKIGASAEDSDNLIQRAASKYKVIIVSPTSFLAYLQTVLQGLKALQIEETAKDIVKRVNELGTHLKKYEDFHIRLGASLVTVVNHYNHSGKELKKVDKDILRITGQAPGLEPVAIDQPEEMV